MKTLAPVNSTKEKWLQCGYRDFAEYGPEQLSIKRMAKSMGASRSSFYHYFGDLDIFIDELLIAHWELCEQFNQEGKKKCKKLVPDLYQLLESYPVGLRFSLQLFHHRHHSRYNYMFIKTYEQSSRDFGLALFTKHMNLSSATSEEVLNLYKTLGESWYSRLDPQDFSAETLQRHAESIMEDLSHFVYSGLYTSLR